MKTLNINEFTPKQSIELAQGLIMQASYQNQQIWKGVGKALKDFMPHPTLATNKYLNGYKVVDTCDECHEQTHTVNYSSTFERYLCSECSYTHYEAREQYLDDEYAKHENIFL